jgi:hypothetical protein
MHIHTHANKKGMRSAVSHSNVEKKLIFSPVNHTPLQWRWERNQCTKKSHFFLPLDVAEICGLPAHPFSLSMAMENEKVLLYSPEGTMKERMCALKKGAKWVLTIGRERRLVESVVGGISNEDTGSVAEHMQTFLCCLPRC